VGLRPLACFDRGFESRRERGCLIVVSVVCCQVEVSAFSRSRVQSSPTERGVSECDREASIMRRPGPTGGCCPMESKLEHFVAVDGVIINLCSLFYLSADVAFFRCDQVCGSLFVMFTAAVISVMWPMTIVILVFMYFSGLRMTT